MIVPDPAPSIGEIFASLTPSRQLSEILRWPPDTFAFTSVMLEESGIYRLAVSPHDSTVRWPPQGWEREAKNASNHWISWIAGSRDVMPKFLHRFQRTVEHNWNVPVVGLADIKNWDCAKAFLTLHAISDQCGAVLNSPHPSPNHLTSRIFYLAAQDRLRITGSLSTLNTSRVRVFPKMRVPMLGITPRSLSRYLALDRGEIQTTWLTGADLPTRQANTFNILLIPWPDTVLPRDFREAVGSESNERFAFFDASFKERIDPHKLGPLIKEAKLRVGRIDAAILPEAAVDEEQLEACQRILQGEGVPLLIAGVKNASHTSSHLHRNFVSLGLFSGVRWFSYEQDKHHRWRIEAEQIQQYHLGSSLHSQKVWWEAIEIPPRKLTFVSLGQGLLLCPLICEDLARQEPVTRLIRSVGPTLIIAILCDGPQLASRWPARYATVLAEDPGSSVLTLTCLGMAERCRPTGFPACRTIGLWKDRRHGAAEISLEPGASAIVLSTHLVRAEGTTADGRRDDSSTVEITFAGINQISISG